MNVAVLVFPVVRLWRRSDGGVCLGKRTPWLIPFNSVYNHRAEMIDARLYDMACATSGQTSSISAPSPTRKRGG